MDKIPLMQRVLGTQWEQLPPALQKHYMFNSNVDVGALDISYPSFMQPYLNLLRLLGALINRRGEGIPTTVSKRMEGDIQQWERSVSFPDGRIVLFNSRWEYVGGNELIEYVNSVIGLKMAAHVEAQQLYYSGRHFVIRLGSLRLPVPEWLVLGHTTILERAVDENAFAMDFRLRHPWFGELFRYAGDFRTE